MINHNSLRPIALAITSALLTAACQPTVKKQTAQEDAALAAAAAASAAQAAATAAAAAQQSHVFNTSAEVLMTNHSTPASGVLTQQTKMTVAQVAAAKSLNPAAIKTIEHTQAFPKAPVVSVPASKP